MILRLDKLTHVHIRGLINRSKDVTSSILSLLPRWQVSHAEAHEACYAEDYECSFENGLRIEVKVLQFEAQPDIKSRKKPKVSTGSGHSDAQAL